MPAIRATSAVESPAEPENQGYYPCIQCPVHLNVELGEARTATLPAANRPVVVRGPNRRPGIRESLRALFSHGDLFRTLTAHRIRVRYKQSALGVAWTNMAIDSTAHALVKHCHIRLRMPVVSRFPMSPSFSW